MFITHFMEKIIIFVFYLFTLVFLYFFLLLCFISSTDIWETNHLNNRHLSDSSVNLG